MSGNKDEQVPKPNPGVNITKLGLNQEEGFIASRVDGIATISEIAMIVGKNRADVEKILKKLQIAGAVVFEGQTPARRALVRTPSKIDANKPDYGEFIFQPSLMMEDGDLSREERKRIIFFFESLPEWTFYELLQVKRKDDQKTIKRAYFERSKEWHPDRFRRGNLGSFKKMIDTIFKRIQEAQRVLEDDEKRPAYDETIIHMVDEEDLAEMMAHKNKLEREARREQEHKDRRHRNNPLVKRMEQAKALYEDALRLKTDGKLLEALRAAQTAETYDKKEAYSALVEELKGTASESRIGPLMRRGTTQESMTQWAEAIEAFTEAVRLAPEHGPARMRLAYNLVMSGREQDANQHAQKAVSLLPDDAEAHYVLGVCYERGGMEKAAVRELNRALELKPNHAEAKKHLKKLKWGF